MNKIKLDNVKSFGFPMPVVLVGAIVAEKPTFMTAAWITRVESTPPLIAVALANHYTNTGIQEKKEFSINIPGDSIVSKVDHCGTTSGRLTDKASVFRIFNGNLDSAPMIEECSVSLECVLYKTIQILKHTIFIGEVKGIYSEEKYITENKLDDNKIRALLVTMPENNYHILGEKVGDAWNL
ncbi:MAG: flavin reductase family protein [Spirochaetales bacterium]|nr:flavin reductase family protein [Spirochaetales bacterium]